MTEHVRHKHTLMEGIIALCAVAACLSLVVVFFQTFAARAAIPTEVEELALAPQVEPVAVPLPVLNPIREAKHSTAYLIGETLAMWKEDHGLSPFRSTPYVAASFYAEELNCLTQAIYYEARSESVSGRLAVAQVVLNRVKNKYYPNSICKVVHQGPLVKSSRGGCQFSFTCDGSMDRPLQVKHWDRSEELAQQVMLGFAADLVNKATHYHANYVDPDWSKSLHKTVQIGTHIFYRKAS